jgi:hypothetical protein
MNPPGVKNHGTVPYLWEVVLYPVAFELGVLFENIIEKRAELR